MLFGKSHGNTSFYNNPTDLNPSAACKQKVELSHMVEITISIYHRSYSSSEDDEASKELPVKPPAPLPPRGYFGQKSPQIGSRQIPVTIDLSTGDTVRPGNQVSMIGMFTTTFKKKKNLSYMRQLQLYTVYVDIHVYVC